MATKIRLQRGGAKKKPYYRIVVADSRAPRDGKFIERIGSYNPMLPKGDEKRVELLNDRVEHWLSTGAVPTERVALFISKAGLANDNPSIKQILKKRDNTIELKKAEIEAKKKAEAEKKKEEEAKKAAEEKAAKEAEEAQAKADAEAAKAEEAETPAE